MFAPPRPLTPDDRRRMLVMRAWSPRERRVVMRGMFGRLAIAVEPAALALLFAGFVYLLVRSGNPYHGRLLAPIFAIGAVAFCTYAIVIMIRPVRAALETCKPIFILDGYVRTRGRDDFSEYGSSGYVAALLPDRRVACEWPVEGSSDLPRAEHPAYLEFSEFGGIHSIDGRSTGVLPDDFPVFGVGGNRPPSTSKNR